MKRIFDWLFLSDDQYFNKYVLPERLGGSPYAGARLIITHSDNTIHLKKSPMKRLFLWIFG